MLRRPAGLTRDLLLEFLESDADAQAWGGEDFEDAADCDQMAVRFANFLAGRGVIGRVELVRITSPHDGMVDEHFFTVVQGIAVDWTARQFHNVKGVNLTPSDIPSPLLFVWPGPYPIPTLTAEEVA